MVHSLELALNLGLLQRPAEVVVSQNVFLHVLRQRNLNGERGNLLLNGRYDSPRHRFLHRAFWRGILFIHLSGDPLTQEQVACAEAERGRNTKKRAPSPG
jgi:hypothetical protein